MASVTPAQIAAPIVLILLVLFFFWRIVVRPSQVRQQEHRDLVDKVRLGDRVVTAGGIYGKVVNIDEKTVGLEIARGITVTFDRRAIVRMQDG